MPRADDHRRSERRRLEQRMQSCTAKSAAHVRNVGKSVQIPEYSETINDDHIGFAGARTIDS